MDSAIVLFVVILATLIGMIPAMIAENRGVAGNGFLWWVAGMLLFPIALLAALLMKPDMKLLEKKELEDGASKKCPQCAELVKKAAVKCRFCQYEFKPTIVGNKDCPSCGQSVMREAVRCKHCGHAFARRRA